VVAEVDVVMVVLELVVEDAVDELLAEVLDLVSLEESDVLVADDEVAEVALEAAPPLSSNWGL